MKNKKTLSGPIGIFDSGFGGLTVLKEIIRKLPEYDFIYLGDNARTPYGNRSYETVYSFTLECVKYLFEKNCSLVILACNSASAKALRTIQQKDLPLIAPDKRVLGVIRPTAEIVGNYSTTRHVGILGTTGTVSSRSYPVEIHKFFPDIMVHQQACPLWVPIIENNEIETPGADYFIRKYMDELLAQDEKTDTIILGCTHYPLLIHKLEKIIPPHITLLSQGEIVADSLRSYLLRHPEMDARCSKNKSLHFFTTDSAEIFDKIGSEFFGQMVRSVHLKLSNEKLKT